MEGRDAVQVFVVRGVSVCLLSSCSFNTESTGVPRRSSSRTRVATIFNASGAGVVVDCVCIVCPDLAMAVVEVEGVSEEYAGEREFWEELWGCIMREDGGYVCVYGV